MLTLTTLDGSIAGNRYTLTQGALLIGRALESNIRFDSESEPGVSAKHALIQETPHGYYLADLGSANGTYLNGQPVQQSLIKDGDTIQIGRNGPRIRVSAPDRLTEKQSPPPIIPRSIPPVVQVFEPGSRLPQISMENIPNIALFMLSMGSMGTLLSLMLVIGASGPAAGLIGMFTAFAPVRLYLSFWLWLDRYDIEPKAALLGALAWGAGMATFVAIVINSSVDLGVSSVLGKHEAFSFTAVFVAPFVEEACKGSGLILLLLFMREEFDGILDGIVYAGVIALGFATIENIEYYGRAFSKGGAFDLLLLLVFRGALMPFMHALFTSMTGIGCGVSRETHSRNLRITAPILGYLAAVFLHALHNGAATFFQTNPEGELGFYFTIEVPIFLVLMAFVAYQAQREGKILHKMLSMEAERGLLTTWQVELLCSPAKRSAWQLAAISSPRTVRARKQFLRAATRLGLSHWHLSSAMAAGEQTISFPQIPILRAQVAELQKRI